MSELLFFYLFSGLVLISATMVITVSNPVHSVLFLILGFVGSAAILLLLKVEFLSLMFVIIYVGAIAVLFLFVVMMLDIKLKKSGASLGYTALGAISGLFLFFQFFYFIEKISPFSSSFLLEELFSPYYFDWIDTIDKLTNMECLGQFLYTYYFFHFLIGGILLLVGMIGGIVLTLHVNYKSKTIQK